jgi:hypothetical protein
MHGNTKNAIVRKYQFGFYPKSIASDLGLTINSVVGVLVERGLVSLNKSQLLEKGGVR